MQATEGKAKQKLLLFSSVTYFFNLKWLFESFQHDGTMISFLYSLNVSNGLMVPYTSAIIMEVYSDNNSSRNQVEVFLSRS